ncbi:SusC/RagA family TonB-linked outer membrane protein [Ancylomarina sp. 16SWW S1-10-2]|uniref:SusC/RagA family TonB-linked outer membrane protein n=1 Tax=Ancylomarina sp. 16SWW S1-10-2 TaxID=2499681 RepID=UPI0012AD61A6|nr:SusC/RagA family TonB-linked outer membrane protein [Ancylomarina sp. 16SWW S1-10-2]MRT93243.1 SusC/RagA family TonB-linked outer membrane protein [Ancylomarina sp. 16SWW S1-10-2]
MKKIFFQNTFAFFIRWMRILRTMRNVIVLIIAFGFQASAGVFSQSRVNVDLKNSSIENLIKIIEEQTDLGFLYDASQLREVNPISVSAQNESVENVLNEAFKNTGLGYEVDHKTILIKALDLKVDTNQEKEKIIKGKVVDESKLPLPGVSVVVKGTTHGVTTDFDGNYTISVSDHDTVLIFSFIGMISQEYVLKSGDNLVNVTLVSHSEQLGEVVVTTGYQKIDRKLFAGSATKLTAEDTKIEGIVDVSRMIEGRSAGVQVQNVSGTFGAAPKIRVRGASSIYGDQKPLWVVDGVVLEDLVNVSADELSSGDAETLISSSVAGINSDDIESFQILKDAAATALYGAKAMNGVIVITTKKGVRGKTRISYTSNWTVKMKPEYSDYNIMNSKDQMSVYSQMQDKGWLNHADVSQRKDGGVFLKMYDLINQYDPATGFGLENTSEARDRFLQKYEMANTDWFDILFKNSIAQEHSVSLSSGTERSQTYVSTSFYNDEGWSISSKVKRYTANFKNTVQINDKLKVGFSSVGSIREQNAPGTTKRVDNVFEGAYSRSFDINPFSYALNTSRTMRAYDDNGNYEFYKRDFAPFNILHELKNNKIKLNILDLNLQADLEYKFNPHLTYNFIGSLRYVKSTREHEINEKSNYAQAHRMAPNSVVRKANQLLYLDPEDVNGEKVSVLPEGGFYNRYENYLKSTYIRNVLTYNNTIKEKHLINAMFGQEIKSSDRQQYFNNGPGYQYGSGGVPFTDYRYYKQALEGNQDIYSMGWTYDRYLAFFTNLAYSYKGKYTINGTARVDGSNQLGQNSRSNWLPTWNLSASWNVTEEDWMKDQNIVSMLKLRGTYGLTASMGAATNSTAILKNQVTNRPYLSEKETGIKIESLENSNLTWEKQYETNIGIDLGLFKNRISIISDVYYRQGFDLIGVLKTSGIGGEGYKYGNYADMTSKGVELTLNTKNVVAKDFKWTSNFTFAYNENEITNLKSKPRVYDLILAEGGPIEGSEVRSLYSIPFAGLDEYGVPTFYGEDGEVTQKINLQSNVTDYLKYEGPVDPKITGGFDNKFKYKNWDLSVFISYAAGNKIRLNSIFKSQYNDMDAMSNEFKNRWTMFGDENVTNIPTILGQRQESELYDYPMSYYNYSSARVANGDFVRLKSLALTYNFPKEMVNKLGLNNASLKAQATNLWLIYSDKDLYGQDPEFYSSGGVALPQPKQFTVTLKVGL